MKKLLTALLFVAIIGCSKESPEPETNPVIGTSWEAPDEIADIIYGRTCTSVLEFLTNSQCQEIDKKNGAVRKLTAGTYTYSNSKVTVALVGETVFTGTISGSVMTTTRGTPSGPVIFTKK